MSATERRREILKAICLRRFDTRENLAFEFGVSSRTIDYDITALSLEYPIYTVQGKGGGVYVAEWYRYGMKYLSEKQREVLKKLGDIAIGEDREVLKSILQDFSR